MQDRPYLGYLRVSTEEQAVKGLGLDAQRAAISAEAERRGWPEVRFIEDAGHTGRHTRRPGLTVAREVLRRGEAAGLVAAKMDRLSRSLLDFVTIMGEAQAQDWQLIALDCPVDADTPMGEAMASVAAVFAQLERRMIAQRTKDALAVRRAQGVRLGRPRRTPDHVVARVTRERAEGRSLRDIAAGLDADGVPTVMGGRCWHASTVAALAKAAVG